MIYTVYTDCGGPIVVKGDFITDIDLNNHEEDNQFDIFVKKFVNIYDGVTLKASFKIDHIIAITMNEESEVEESSGWISTRDRLPEDRTWAIFSNGVDQSIEKYENGNFSPQGRWFDFSSAVKWMPLPGGDDYDMS